MRTEEYQRREEKLAGWPVGIVSYRLGDTWYCEIDNVSPGARIVRAKGPTRADAERDAKATATRRLARTKVHEVD
jgi:hypothetical protein